MWDIMNDGWEECQTAVWEINNESVKYAFAYSCKLNKC